MEGIDVPKFYYRDGYRNKELILPEGTIIKPVVGYEKLYSVTSNGLLISHHRRRPFMLRTSQSKDGYVRTSLCDRGKHYTVYLHRLIAEAFIPNPDHKPQVNHINGVKGDNRVINLEWCTIAENIQHGHAMGLMQNGERHWLSKLTQADVTSIRTAAATGVLQKDLAKQYGVSPMAISSLMTGKTWKQSNSMQNLNAT